MRRRKKIAHNAPLPAWPWPGGKRHRVEHILPLMPESIGTFYAPFLGAGAVELAVMASEREIRRVVLGDANARVAHQWNHVAADPTRVFEELAALEVRNDFYLTRDEFNASAPGEFPAHFIWCVTRAWSGLWRVNAEGEFNASVDKDKARPLPSLERLTAIATTLNRRGAHVQHLPWVDTVRGVGEGDVVFLDPPYLGTFSKYSAHGWSQADWSLLCLRIVRWVEAGARVILCENLATLEGLRAFSLPMTVAAYPKKNNINGAVASTMVEGVACLDLGIEFVADATSAPTNEGGR